jgi:hypothetical protein
MSHLRQRPARKVRHPFLKTYTEINVKSKTHFLMSLGVKLIIHKFFCEIFHAVNLTVVPLGKLDRQNKFDT